MDRLKLELRESITALADHQSFLVICFHSESYALGGRNRWTSASGEGKRWAVSKVNEINAAGGTEPGPGFEMIFAMNPRADAIYFMTDGIFDQSVAAAVQYMNRGGRRIPIHCIAFGERGAEPLLQQMARDSGGSYTYVPDGSQ